MRTDPVARSSIPVAAAAGLLHRHRPDAHRVAREPPRTRTHRLAPREETKIVVVVHHGLGAWQREPERNGQKSEPAGHTDATQVNRPDRECSQKPACRRRVRSAEGPSGVTRLLLEQ
jgi:hypothetical protein